MQSVFAGEGDGPGGRGEDSGGLRDGDELLREVAQLQEGWHSLLESSHYHTNQR